MNGQNEPTAAVSKIKALIKNHGTSAAAFLVRIIAAGFAYLLQIALARFLGVAEYGLFAIAWNVVLVGGFAAGLGLGPLAIRYMPQYSVKEETLPFARGYFVRAFLVVMAVSLLISLFGSVFVSASGLLSSNLAACLLLAFLIIPIIALSDISDNIARSEGWVWLALAPSYILRQALVLCALIGFFWFGATMNALLALKLSLVAFALTSVVQFFLVRKYLQPVLGGFAPRAYKIREWAGAALPVFLSVGAIMLRNSIDVFILAAFVSKEEVALYFAATRLAALLGLPEFAVSAASGHKFARLEAEQPQNLSLIQRLLRDTSRLVFAATLAFTAILLLLLPFILGLFGASFLKAAPLLYVMIIGVLSKAWTGSSETILNAIGEGKAFLRGNVIGLAVTILLCLALVPFFGAMGAAIALSFGLIVTSYCMARAIRKKYGVWPHPFLKIQ